MRKKSTGQVGYYMYSAVATENRTRGGGLIRRSPIGQGEAYSPHGQDTRDMEMGLENHPTFNSTSLSLRPCYVASLPVQEDEGPLAGWLDGGSG